MTLNKEKKEQWSRVGDIQSQLFHLRKDSDGYSPFAVSRDLCQDLADALEPIWKRDTNNGKETALL